MQSWWCQGWWTYATGKYWNICGSVHHCPAPLNALYSGRSTLVLLLGSFPGLPLMPSTSGTSGLDWATAVFLEPHQWPECCTPVLDMGVISLWAWERLCLPILWVARILDDTLSLCGGSQTQRLTSLCSQTHQPKLWSSEPFESSKLFLSYLPNPFLPQTTVKPRSFQHGHQWGAGLTPVSALTLPDPVTLSRALDLSISQFALLQRIDVGPCSLQPKQEVDFGPQISFIRPFYQWVNHVQVKKTKKKYHLLMNNAGGAVLYFVTFWLLVVAFKIRNI